MRIEGTYTFPAPIDRVVATLVDPDMLALALPGCERLIQFGPPQADGTRRFEVRLRYGADRAITTATLTATPVRQPARIVLILHGSGPTGPVGGRGQIDLVEREHETLAAYIWNVEAAATPEAQARTPGDMAAQDYARTLCRRVAEELRPERNGHRDLAALNGRADGLSAGGVVHTARGAIVALPARLDETDVLERLRPVATRAAWMGVGLAAGLGALGLMLAVARKLEGAPAKE